MSYLNSVFVISYVKQNQKPKKDGIGTEQTWKSFAPSLQQRATQANCVIKLYENCWLIPAEKMGYRFSTMQ